MEIVSIEKYSNGKQGFVVKENNIELAMMEMSITGNLMTVYHTEVSPLAEGRGLGKVLLKAMVDYARQHQLKVIPLCNFVQAQFKRHRELYSAIWQKNEA